MPNYPTLRMEVKTIKVTTEVPSHLVNIHPMADLVAAARQVIPDSVHTAMLTYSQHGGLRFAQVPVAVPDDDTTGGFRIVPFTLFPSEFDIVQPKPAYGRVAGRCPLPA